MTQSPLHIVFTPSGAASLRQALADAGRDDQVIAFFDNLSFGPINPPDPELRATWIEDQLYLTDYLDVSGASPAFWDEVLATTRRRIVWTSRRCAMEHAGFLEYIWRLGDLLSDVIDLTDHEVSRKQTVSMAVIPPYQFNDDKLYDAAMPLAVADRDAHQTLWTKLQSENAPLRVMENGTLRSAPISFFDTILLSFVTKEWKKAAHVVEEALAAQYDDKVLQQGDLFLAGRLNKLGSDGRIECRNSSHGQFLSSDIRLPTT